MQTTVYNTVTALSLMLGPLAGAETVSFDVTRFGAVADGTDCRLAFQAAELAARQHELENPDDDVEIVVPAGTWYYETGPMDSGMEWIIGGNVAVRGAGMHVTTIRVGPDPPTLVPAWEE